jgi:transposase
MMNISTSPQDSGENNGILARITDQQATENTKLHLLYGFFFLGIPVKVLSKIYCKSVRTVQYWINRWANFASVARLNEGVNSRKYNDEKQAFIIDCYRKQPCLFLGEAKELFDKEFHVNISRSTIWRIIHNAGLTRQVIERRAIEICVEDITRFFKDLESLPFRWTYENLIFLDEVGFDNRDMFRKRGYGLRGNRIVYRGEFTRKERCSLLCFLGVNGMQEVYSTEGTFDRFKFIGCCRKFALQTGKVEQYPGRNSVWILDGASIHIDPYITYYLRSIGIFTVYLPAYCPFFNPIEIVFGNVKSALQRNYIENRSLIEMRIFVAETMKTFEFRSMKGIFKKCGYISSGQFDPGKAFSQDIRKFGF